MAATLFSTSLSPQFLSLSAKPNPATPSATATFPSGAPQLRALSVAAAWRPLAPVRAAAAVAEELDAEGLAGGEEEEEFSADLRIFVGNLPFSVDSAQLAGLFEQAGSVEMVEVCLCMQLCILSAGRSGSHFALFQTSSYRTLVNLALLMITVPVDKLIATVLRNKMFVLVTLVGNKNGYQCDWAGH